MTTQTTRALAYFPSDGATRLIDFPVKPLDPNEILVRITRVALTRRDRLLLDNREAVLPEGEDFIVPGHIAMGRVVETGSLVRDFEEGDIVVPTIRRDCDRCIDARSDLCPHPERYQDSGLTGAHGFARELLTIRGRYLVKVPPHLENLAMLLAPLSIAEKAHHEAVQITNRYNFYCYHQQEDVAPRALITGLGPVGIMMAYLLSLYNYKLTIFCRRESDDLKAKILDPLEIEYINTLRVPVEGLEKAEHNFMQLFETTGDPEYLLSIMPFMSPNAIMALMGAPEDHASGRALDVDLNRALSGVVMGNQIIFGSIKAGRDAFESAVKHLSELSDLYSNSLESLLTGTFAMSEFQRLLDMDMRDVIIPSLLLT
ncbi:MAG: alcohol dehydrogenase catalytic domain-containing protein [bacterium]|nr:MAG: alcohol dehydrogenase catalytic domain-containing protein [bacterium]